MDLNHLSTWPRRLLALAAILSLMSGCATVHEMGVDKNTETLNLNGDGLVLMSLELSNQYKPDYQPQVLVTHVETPDADSTEDRHNFKTDLDGTINSGGGSRYMLRMQLKPGKYVVRGATCMYRALLLNAICLLPIHADIEVSADTVTYLGRVSGVMRERKDDEFRAGPVIPLIDQGVTGFSSSTFDVTISDQSEEDLKSYRMLFPALSKAEIRPGILPPFDRARAQAWWETNGDSESAEPKVTQSGE